jgi:hypothetical protein
MANVSLILAVATVPAPQHGGFDATLLGLPVVGEGETREHAVWNLCEAVCDYVDVHGLNDAVVLLRTWGNSVC